MFWHEKINNRTYVALTIMNLGIAALFGAPGLVDIFWLAVLVICSVGNHYFMVHALASLVNSRMADHNAPSSGKLIWLVLVKTLFLITGFMTLIIYAPHKVLQGLSLYIFQLIILGLSIKNIGKFFKKGSH